MRDPKVQNVPEETKEKSDDKKNNVPCFGYRHIMALLGCSVLTVMNMERTSTSVAVVAMANSTLRVQTVNTTATKSCFYNESTNLNSNISKETGDFNWDATQQGTILGLGFAGYVCSNAVAGRVAESFGAKWTLIYGNIVSTICTLLSPVAAYWSIYALIALHYVRGVAQGFNLPPIFVLMANWFPRSERSLLSAVVMNGFCLGPVISAMLSGWLCDVPVLGWPSVFYIFGGVHVLLCLVLVFIYHESPHSHPHISPEERKYITQEQEEKLSKKRPPLPWKKMFTSLPVYALFIGVLGMYWSSTHLFTMHPAYMKNVLQYSMTQNGLLTALPFVFTALGSAVAGFTSNKMENWFTHNTTRKVHNSIFCLGFSVGLLGVTLAGCDRMMSTVSFYICGFFIGVGLSGCIVVCADMTPNFSGTLSGISTTLASMAPATIPIFAGEMTKHGLLEEWKNVFYMHIGVVLATGVFFNLFGSAKLQDWNSIEPNKQEGIVPTLKIQPSALKDSETTHM